VDLHLKLPGNQELGPADAPYCIRLLYPWSARAALAWPFGLTAGEAYVEELVDFDGDVAAVIEQFYNIGLALSSGLPWRSWLTLLRLRNRLARPPARSHDLRASLKGRLHSQPRDRAAIAFHYDLPQQFYELFLGANLTYSCAYFGSRDEDLDSAQRRKLDLVCGKLRLTSDSRLLDVGCGWGSLLIHAARTYGCSGTGVTLSETQYESARRRIDAAGLTGRVRVLLRDYRDVSGQYDAISSIGMLEHVGPRHLPSYLSVLRTKLADGGLMLNHAIVLNDSNRVRTGRESDFIARYVFPDGGLVPAWRLVQACEQAGMRIIDLEQLGPHYGMTIRRWLTNLEQNHRQVAECASESHYRIWRAYMGQSIFGFESEQLGVVQVLTTARLSRAALPLGRRWMSPAP
jgi:cyclopropane-fatty-acyl-phospholipid synthase